MNYHGRMMNYHGRMMNLPLRKRPAEISEIDLAYKYGHRDARHAAAEIAIEADGIIAELLGALEEIVARNEIQHWFNLDQARAAIAKATGENND